MKKPVDNLEQFFAPSNSREGHYAGWRCDGFGAGPENGALVRDVISHEREVNGKDIEVDEDLLREIDKAGLWAGDVLWVCQSAKEAVMRYGIESMERDDEVNEVTMADFRGELSEAREVFLGPEALVLGTDEDGGYLVLMDASRLDKEKVAALKAQRNREEQSTASLVL